MARHDSDRNGNPLDNISADDVYGLLQEFERPYVDMLLGSQIPQAGLEDGHPVYSMAKALEVREAEIKKREERDARAAAGESPDADASAPADGAPEPGPDASSPEPASGDAPPESAPEPEAAQPHMSYERRPGLLSWMFNRKLKIIEGKRQAMDYLGVSEEIFDRLLIEESIRPMMPDPKKPADEQTLDFLASRLDEIMPVSLEYAAQQLEIHPGFIRDLVDEGSYTPLDMNGPNGTPRFWPGQVEDLRGFVISAQQKGIDLTVYEEESGGGTTSQFSSVVQAGQTPAEAGKIFDEDRHGVRSSIVTRVTEMLGSLEDSLESIGDAKRRVEGYRAALENARQQVEGIGTELKAHASSHPHTDLDTAIAQVDALAPVFDTGLSGSDSVYGDILSDLTVLGAVVEGQKVKLNELRNAQEISNIDTMMKGFWESETSNINNQHIPFYQNEERRIQRSMNICDAEIARLEPLEEEASRLGGISTDAVQRVVEGFFSDDEGDGGEPDPNLPKGDSGSNPPTGDSSDGNPDGNADGGSSGSDGETPEAQVGDFYDTHRLRIYRERRAQLEEELTEIRRHIKHGQRVTELLVTGRPNEAFIEHSSFMGSLATRYTKSALEVSKFADDGVDFMLQLRQELKRSNIGKMGVAFRQMYGAVDDELADPKVESPIKIARLLAMAMGSAIEYARVGQEGKANAAQERDEIQVRLDAIGDAFREMGVDMDYVRAAVAERKLREDHGEDNLSSQLRHLQEEYSKREELVNTLRAQIQQTANEPATPPEEVTRMTRRMEDFEHQLSVARRLSAEMEFHYCTFDLVANIPLDLVPMHGEVEGQRQFNEDMTFDHMGIWRGFLQAPNERKPLSVRDAEAIIEFDAEKYTHDHPEANDDLVEAFKRRHFLREHMRKTIVYHLRGADIEKLRSKTQRAEEEAINLREKATLHDTLEAEEEGGIVGLRQRAGQRDEAVQDAANVAERARRAFENSQDLDTKLAEAEAAKGTVEREREALRTQFTSEQTRANDAEAARNEAQRQAKECKDGREGFVRRAAGIQPYDEHMTPDNMNLDGVEAAMRAVGAETMNHREAGVINTRDNRTLQDELSRLRNAGVQNAEDLRISRASARKAHTDKRSAMAEAADLQSELGTERQRTADLEQLLTTADAQVQDRNEIAERLRNFNEAFDANQRTYEGQLRSARQRARTIAQQAEVLERELGEARLAIGRLDRGRPQMQQETLWRNKATELQTQLTIKKRELLEATRESRRRGQVHREIYPTMPQDHQGRWDPDHYIKGVIRSCDTECRQRAASRGIDKPRMKRNAVGIFSREEFFKYFQHIAEGIGGPIYDAWRDDALHDIAEEMVWHRVVHYQYEKGTKKLQDHASMLGYLEIAGIKFDRSKVDPAHLRDQKDKYSGMQGRELLDWFKGEIDGWNARPENSEYKLKKSGRMYTAAKKVIEEIARVGVAEQEAASLQARVSALESEKQDADALQTEMASVVAADFGGMDDTAFDAFKNGLQTGEAKAYADKVRAGGVSNAELEAARQEITDRVGITVMREASILDLREELGRFQKAYAAMYHAATDGTAAIDELPGEYTDDLIMSGDVSAVVSAVEAIHQSRDEWMGRAEEAAEELADARGEEAVQKERAESAEAGRKAMGDDIAAILAENVADMDTDDYDTFKTGTLQTDPGRNVADRMRDHAMHGPAAADLMAINSEPIDTMPNDDYDRFRQNILQTPEGKQVADICRGAYIGWNREKARADKEKHLKEAAQDMKDVLSEEVMALEREVANVEGARDNYKADIVALTLTKLGELSDDDYINFTSNDLQTNEARELAFEIRQQAVHGRASEDLQAILDNDVASFDDDGFGTFKTGTLKTDLGRDVADRMRDKSQRAFDLSAIAGADFVGMDDPAYTAFRDTTLKTDTGRQVANSRRHEALHAVDMTAIAGADFVGMDDASYTTFENDTLKTASGKQVSANMRHQALHAVDMESIATANFVNMSDADYVTFRDDTLRTSSGQLVAESMRGNALQLIDVNMVIAADIGTMAPADYDDFRDNALKTALGRNAANKVRGGYKERDDALADILMLTSQADDISKMIPADFDTFKTDTLHYDQSKALADEIRSIGVQRNVLLLDLKDMLVADFELMDDAGYTNFRNTQLRADPTRDIADGLRSYALYMADLESLKTDITPASMADADFDTYKTDTLQTDKGRAAADNLRATYTERDNAIADAALLFATDITEGAMPQPDFDTFKTGTLHYDETRQLADKLRTTGTERNNAFADLGDLFAQDINGMSATDYTDFKDNTLRTAEGRNVAERIKDTYEERNEAREERDHAMEDLETVSGNADIETGSAAEFTALQGGMHTPEGKDSAQRLRNTYEERNAEREAKVNALQDIVSLRDTDLSEGAMNGPDYLHFQLHTLKTPTGRQLADNIRELYGERDNALADLGRLHTEDISPSAMADPDYAAFRAGDLHTPAGRDLADDIRGVRRENEDLTAERDGYRARFDLPEYELLMQEGNNRMGVGDQWAAATYFGRAYSLAMTNGDLVGADSAEDAFVDARQTITRDMGREESFVEAKAELVLHRL